jgi:glycosyltransferase involved in cell wall biosynthesis
MRHKKLEHRVLTIADVVVSVTPFYVDRFEALSGRKAELLTNGYDEEDFQSITYTRPDKFTIRHIGIVNEQRDPVPFMKAFQQLLDEHEDFRSHVLLEFVGDVYEPFKVYILKHTALQPFVRFTGNVSHEKVMEYYGSSSLLLLILTGYRDPHGFFPGKLFEYIATGVSVLGIGPIVSDAAAVLEKAGTGTMVESTDVGGIKVAVLKAFTEWKSSDTPIVRKGNIEVYSRKVITEKLVAYLK